MATHAADSPCPDDSLDAGPAKPAAEWLSIGEKGTVLGIRMLVWVCRVLGRKAARLLLRLIVLYYVVFHRSVRRHSRSWLERVHGRPARMRDVYQHVFRFAQVTMDQVFLLQHRREQFQFTHSGREDLYAQAASGRGALLLTAHMGSPAALSVDGTGLAQSIHIAGHFRNARMVNAVFQRLDPETNARFIHLVPGSIDSVLSIQERVLSGGLVVLAADRVGVNERHHMVPFMGAPAAFPTGPFLLASLLRCPILLVLAIYREPNRYDLLCERLSEGIDVPRSERGEAIESHIAQFVERLEHHARKTPDNWFNFYDFWRVH